MATSIKLINLGFYSTLFLAFSFIVSSDIYGQTSAIGQCTGISAEDNFKIFVDRDTASPIYRVYIDGIEVDTMLAISDFTSEDIPFVDGTKSYTITLKNITNLNDSLQFIVHEVLCTDIDDNGTMDFNTADCDYTKTLNTGGAIVSTVAPFNSDHVYLYILTDSSGAFSTPVTNYSGHFEDLSDGEYRVSAYHFLDTTDANGFVTALGTSGDIDDFSSMSNPVCYNFCGGQNYTVECACIVSIDQNPTDYTTCANDSAGFYVVTSLTENVANSDLVYQWEKSTDDGSSFAPMAVELDSVLSINPVIASDSGYQYRVIVTLEVSSVVICRDTSSAGILNVDPLPELATDLDLTVCSDEATGITLAVGPGSVAASSYNIVSIDSIGVTPSAGSPSTGVTSSASEIADDAWTNTSGAPVTVTYQVAPQSGDGCVGDTIDIDVVVDPAPVYTGPITETVCSDDIIGIIIPATDDFSNAMDSFVVSSVKGDNLTGTPTVGTTIDTNFIKDDVFNNVSGLVDTVTYTITPFSGDCSGEDFTIYAIVNPEPVFATDIAETVCSDDVIGIVIPATDDFSNAMDSFVVSALVGTNLTGTPTQGGTTDPNFISIDSFNNVSGLVDTVTYTITPYSGDCSGEDFTIYAIVNPEPVFASDITETVCSDVSIGENIPFIDDNSLTIDSVDIVVVIGDSLSGTSVVGAGMTGITSTTFIAMDEYTNTTSVIDSVVYTITPYSGACEGSSYDIVIEVTPEPVGSDPELIVCSDEAFTIDLSSLITNGAMVDSFTWIATANDTVTGESITLQETGMISQTLTNIFGYATTVEYTVTPQSTSGSSGCIGDPFTVTVTVRPEPVAEDEVVTVCSEEPIDVVLTDNITQGLTVKGFIYTVDNGGGTARTDTSAGNLTDTYTNTTGSDITVVYTVTPITNDDCVGDDFTVTVTVEPEPVLATDLDATVCSDSDIGVTLAVDALSVSADSFNIVSITPQGGLTADGGNASTGKYGVTSAISGDSYGNEGSSSLTVTYAIAPISASGCIGDTVDVVVTIDPEAVVDAGMDETICSNGEVDLSSKGSISGAATTGGWSAPSGDGTFANSTYNDPLAAYTPGPNDIAAGTVTLVLTSAEPEDSCPAEDDSVIITINDVECSEFPWNGN